MAKDIYELLEDEYIVLKDGSVRHGFWGAYTDELLLTNMNIRLVRKGVFGNNKGNIIYPLDSIVLASGKPQVIIGEASNGEKQLEVYFKNGREDFAFQSGNYRTLQLWVLAINDRFEENNEIYDYNYYQQFRDIDNLNTLIEERNNSGYNNQSISRDEAISSITSSLIPKKVSKDIRKVGNKKNLGLLNGLMEVVGINEIVDDIKDEFTEVRNEFREEFGMEPIMTKRAYEEQQKKIAEQKKNQLFNEQVNAAKNRINSNNNEDKQASNLAIEKEIELLKQLKELLDSGIITQEEFETKKNQIMKR